MDYEAELALVIGKRCKYVDPADWRDVVAGYMIVNDISMRDVQLLEMSRGMIVGGKNADTSCPCGPFLVTADEIADPHALTIETRVNGDVRQHESTGAMLFKIPEIIAYWSRLTLEPGDIIVTGTPGGVGIFSDDPERDLLKPGQEVAISITGLGTLRNTVVAEG